MRYKTAKNSKTIACSFHPSKKRIKVGGLDPDGRGHLGDKLLL